MLLTNAPCVDENSTVQAAIAGDHEAFSELFFRYQPMIHAYAYRLCLNVADAQDATQETFIKAARALPSYRPESPFRNWLYQICTNVVRDWQRRVGRQRRIEDCAEQLAAIDDAEHPADHAGVLGARAALSPDLREAVVMVYMEGMSNGEAAAALGCAGTTGSWGGFLAKRKLKMLLQR